MKQKIHYLFMLLLMLLTGVGGVKAQKTLTEGFEKKEAGTDYQSKVTVNSTESDCGIGWEIYYGNVSTSSKITGNNSAALRLYTSSNYGYIKSTTPVEGLSKVDFNAKAATSNGAKIKINVSYSTDGNSWISLETDKALTSSAAVYSYKIPSGGKFFQIAISSQSTKPSKSSAQLTIDDVVFTYSDLGKENVDLSFGEISSQTVGVGKSVKIEATATPSVPISYSSSDETIAKVSKDGTVEGKKPGKATIKASFAGNDQYNSASDEYELTVIPSELGGDVTEETITINEPYGNSGNNAIILYDKGTNGQNGPFYYNNSELRLYCGNTLTVSSESKKIAKIEFDLVINKNSSNTIPKSITCTSGSCEDFNKLSTSLTSAVWNAPTKNGVSEVTFTINGDAGNVGFKSAKVYYVLKSFDVAPASNNESYGTVSFEEGVITATPAEGYRVSLTNPYEVTPAGAATVVQDGNDFTVTATADCTVQINFEAIPTHTVTFSVNGTETSKSFAEGSNITFDTPDDVQGKQFVGWTTVAIDGTTDECPELVILGIMGNADVTYYAVFANVTAGTATNTVDELTLTTTGVTGTSYSGWSDKKATSDADAVYAGLSAGDKNSIQLRSKDSDSGVISTTSGGRLKKVVVAWHEDTAAGRTLNVYGSNTAYTAAKDLYDESKQGTLLGTIVKGTSTELAVDGDYAYVGLRSASGAMYLTSISITWENTPATYSDYCTTVVAPVKPAKPIIFHDDGGEYEGELTVAIAGEGVKYTLNDGAEETYAGPFTISDEGEYTIKAWAEKEGVKSDVVERTFTIVEKTYDGDTFDGYYTIKNNGGNNMFVNVAGRKTVTFESETADKAGTVIRVKTNDKGQVEVLRSQGVDVPGYAEKAMRYVPEIVKLVVNKLNNLGEGQLMGEAGLEALMNKFNEAFDEHLYLEKAGENSYRIYGRTPSMKHVVDFYAENKANVDAKLPMLEGKINAAIEKVLQKTNGSGQSILVPFKLKTVWQNMGGTLTEPVDEASTMKFYEEVLTSETNVWNFAYQTAMIYWGNLKNNDTFKNYIKKLGDYAKYINKVENIRPNFKYYIVQKDNKLDIISEGNGELNADFTAWTLIPRTDFSVAFNEENVLNNKYYTTLYTDFAYTLPEGKGVKAYKVTKVSEAGVAVKVEMKGIIPAQTPVLLESESAEAQTLLLSTEDGTAPADNILVGADALINQYQIKTAQVEDLFNFAKDILGESFYNTYIQKYEHLMLRYAGTVNNKYFFGLTEDDVDKCTELNEAGKKTCVIRSLSMGDKKLGFYNNWEAKANQAFLVTKDFNPVKLFLVGDVNRDGNISIADVTALVDIILGKATYPEDNDKYDFAAANVNNDKAITISDVTALVNIILGK